jgi:hypothetical protein
MKVSQLIGRLKVLQEDFGDLEVRVADWELVRSKSLLEDEIAVPINSRASDAMSCDDYHNPELVYPYILIGN